MESICFETPHPQRKEITQFMLVKVIKLSPEEELIFFKKNYTLVYIQDLAFDSSRVMIFFFFFLVGLTSEVHSSGQVQYFTERRK